MSARRPPPIDVEGYQVWRQAMAAAVAEARAEIDPAPPGVPTLEQALGTVLDTGGHPAAIWAHICAVPRRNSGWLLLEHGYAIEPTTVRGQLAAYVVYRGDVAEGLTHLQAYAATLTAAGYPVLPVHLRPDRTRTAWPWTRPDPPTGIRALLVQPTEPPT